LKMAMEERGERVPEIAGGAHPVDPLSGISPIAAFRVHSTSEPAAPRFTRVTAGVALR
jgi:hypothetical protein